MNGQRIGYVRVSSLDQNPDRQLEQIPVDRTFTDHASGKDVARPQLDALLRFAREGNTVVVHSMDRLARNLDDLRQIVRALTGRGIRVEFVKEGLTFTGEDAPMATLLLSVMGAFAEFERALTPRWSSCSASCRRVAGGRDSLPPARCAIWPTGAEFRSDHW